MRGSMDTYLPNKVHTCQTYYRRTIYILDTWHNYLTRLNTKPTNAMRLNLLEPMSARGLFAYLV